MYSHASGRWSIMCSPRLTTMDQEASEEQLDLGPTHSFGFHSPLSFGRIGFKMPSRGGDGAGEGEPDYARSLGPPRGSDGDPRRRQLLPWGKGWSRPPLSVVDPVRHLAAEFDTDGDPADDSTVAVVDLPAGGTSGTSGGGTSGGLADAAGARSVRHQLQRSPGGRCFRAPLQRWTGTPRLAARRGGVHSRSSPSRDVPLHVRRCSARHRNPW